MVDLGSSQTRRNLVFGTGECNTTMIRAENAITALLAADARVAHNNQRSGTLTTINRFTGGIVQLDADGSKVVAPLPEWADTEKFST